MTQFNVTIKVPDAAYRDATKRVFANAAMNILRFGGAITLLSLVIGGFVVLAVRRTPDWTRAVRWSLALAVIPVIDLVAGYESSLFDYNTSVRWQTFRDGSIVSAITQLGLRIGLLVLAFAAIDAALPFASRILGRDVRARLGRSAAVAAITAVVFIATVRTAMDLIASRFPSAATLSFNVPENIAQTLPSLIAIGDAIFQAVIGSAVVACLFTSIAAMSKERPWIGQAAATFALFLVSISPGATPAHMPLMLLQAIVVAVAAWIAARFILGTNALAWPLTIFIAAALKDAGGLAINSRHDLRVQAMIIGAAILIALVVMIAPRIEEPHA